MDARTESMKRYVWAVLGLIGILALAWWGSGNVFSFAGERKSTTFLVQGVSCGSCLSAIRNELFKMPGMLSLTADLGQGLLRIDHQPPLSEEAIVRALGDFGYPARPVREQAGKTGGEVKAEGCSGCGPNGCAATVASWRELIKKCGGFFAPKKQRQGEIQ